MKSSRPPAQRLIQVWGLASVLHCAIVYSSGHFLLSSIGAKPGLVRSLLIIFDTGLLWLLMKPVSWLLDSATGTVLSPFITFTLTLLNSVFWGFAIAMIFFFARREHGR